MLYDTAKQGLSSGVYYPGKTCILTSARKSGIKKNRPEARTARMKKFKIQNGTGTCTTIFKRGPNGTEDSYDDIQKIQTKLVSRTMRISPQKLRNIFLNAKFDDLAEINRIRVPHDLGPQRDSS